MIKIDIFKKLNPEGPTQQLDINLEIKRNTSLGIIGPSGAGKTTLLRILAGLTVPDSGTVTFGEKKWFDAKRNLDRPTQQRNIGYVFQDYALFPNMTARQNLEFALPDFIDNKRLTNIMKMLDILPIAHQKPHTLSGGEKQRVALGRALIRQPQLLLLDEPLSALDPEMRTKLQEYLQRVSNNFKGTMILVSHNPAEIIQLTDRAISLANGEITQDGLPTDILINQPKNLDNQEGIILNVLADKNQLIVKTKLGISLLPIEKNTHSNWSIGDPVSFRLKDVSINNQ